MSSKPSALSAAPNTTRSVQRCCETIVASWVMAGSFFELMQEV